MSRLQNSWVGFCSVFAFTLCLLTAAVCVFQIAVDPLDVWNRPLVFGFNNWKMSQWKLDRLFKPHQYLERGPVDVLFFGTSVTNIGYPAYWPGTDESSVYNYGLFGLHTPELMDHVEFVLKTKAPKKIVFAFETLSFETEHRSPTPSFSSERLDMVRLSPATRFLQKIKETVFNLSAVGYSMDTIRQSKGYRYWVYFDRFGWLEFRGGVERTIPDNFVYNTWMYVDVFYRQLELHPKSADELEIAIEKVKHHGVEPVLLLNPLSADFHLILDAHGKLSILEDLKRRLVRIMPVWDFSNINSVTSVRRNYVDGCHHRGEVGKMVMRRVAGDGRDVPRDFGVLLTQENVEAELARQKGRFNSFLAGKKHLHDVFRDAIAHRNRALYEKELKKAIPELFMKKESANAYYPPPTSAYREQQRKGARAEAR